MTSTSNSHPQSQPQPRPRRSLRRLFGFLKPLQWAYLASLVALAAVLTSERLFVAYVIKLFVDAITGASLGLLWQSVGLWLAFLVVWIPADVALTYLWRAVTARAVANLRQSLFSRLQRLPLGYLEQRHSGDLVSVLTNDVSAAEQAFQQDLLNLVNASLQGASAAVFMLALNVPLALIVVGSGLVPLVVNAAFAGPLRRAGEAIQSRLSRVSERLTDLLAGYQVVRTFSLGDWILERFGQASRDLLDGGMQRVRLEAALSGANVLGAVTFILPMAAGASLVLAGQATFGTLVALIQLNNSIQFFVFSLGGAITRLQSALAATDRILAVLDASPEPERLGGVAGPDGAGGGWLEFRDVDFAYPGGRDVLNGMSFRVERGQVAAFVGPSGSGKSTLFKLLLGCYLPGAGLIAVAGRPVSSFRLDDLRDQFAYIPQDAYLYSGSILENIGYGSPGASREQVMAAARAAYAHDFIAAFPDGYDTAVGERGARLSGGQRQRIAIARALLKDAPVLLLDEATSALDSESEEVVQRALQVLMRGRTVLVIAHRLSTVEHADVIYVVDGGRVVEAGARDELLDQGGLFRRLYELQFAASAKSVAS